MAVYKRDYRPYQGRLTPAWSRFLILPRFIFKDIFGSKIVTIFFVLCFMVPLMGLFFLYLRHNARALALLELQLSQLELIGPRFFLVILNIQSVLGMILAAVVGPALVSMDVVNNALPLYFCRPFSRTEYVAGKMCVLATLLSAITWVPLMVLYILQTSLEGVGWAAENLRLAGAIFVGSWIWILLLCFLSLAISAWVKWRPVAGAMIFGAFLVLAGFGEAFNQIVGSDLGTLLNLRAAVESIWSSLFGVESWVRAGQPLYRAWLSLGAAVALCLVLLNRKLQAYEVVR